jgi:hypothetical protein
MVWVALLGIQVLLGDGAFAVVRSPSWRTLAAGFAKPTRA